MKGGLKSNKKKKQLKFLLLYAATYSLCVHTIVSNKNIGTKILDMVDIN
jgi:hypothetical protein